MPTLASSNRAQLRYKLEGVYPTNWGVLQGGNGTNVNMTSESLNFDIKTEMSKSLRSDRLPAGHVQVGAGAQGGINVEHQYVEYDRFYESIVGNTFTVYGTNGVSAAVATLTLTSTTITAGVAPTGADAFTTIEKGAWIALIPPSGATQAVKDYLKGRAFRVSLTTAPTSTVITLDAATPIDTAKAGASISNGKIGTSVVKNGATMSSYSLEVAHEDISVYRQYLGMIPSKMNWKLSSGNIVNGTIEFLGKSMAPLAVATGMGTPIPAQGFTQANATRGVFDILEGGTSISATTYIKSGEFTIDGSLRLQDAVGVFGSAGVAPGTFKVTGTLEVYFADKVMYQKFLDGAGSSMCIPILDVDGNGYVYVFPYIKYTAAKVNATGLDQDSMLSMSFECDFDPVSTSPTYQKLCLIYRVGVAVA